MSFKLTGFLYFITMLSVVACQGTASPSQVAVQAAVQTLPEPTAVSPTSPAVVYIHPTATIELPAFSLPDPNSLPTPIPPTDLPVPTATPLPTVEPSPTITPTPAPTFTPPSLPYTSPNEHYWLRRPIKDGGTVWTDKAYPYGHTRSGTLRPHHGVEFYVPAGTEVIASASGTVRVAGEDGTFAYGPQTNFYGKLIIIELDSQWQGQPVYNLYAHLSEVRVQVGYHVDVQEVIALSGATGVADGAHLHFEVRVGQNSYNHTRNPLLWLYPFPDRGTVAGKVTWPDGSPIYEAPVALHRLDAPSAYFATTTYADSTINGDDNWQENFAFDDVTAGYYEVTVTAGQKKFSQELWVYAYQTSFVEITLPLE